MLISKISFRTRDVTHLTLQRTTDRRIAAPGVAILTHHAKLLPRRQIFIRLLIPLQSLLINEIRNVPYRDNIQLVSQQGILLSCIEYVLHVYV